MGGLFVLSNEMGCVYLDVDVSDEINATTTHKSIAKPMKRYPDQNKDKAEADRTQQGKANLVPYKIRHNTMTSKIMIR